MLLESYAYVYKTAEDAAYWWTCTNEDCFMSNGGYEIAAPEYDWLYWYKDIPECDLLDYPALKAEWEQARTNYRERKIKL